MSTTYNQPDNAEPHIDPVCGMTVEPAQAAEHQGVKYYFCSKSCAAKFRQSPQQYLGGVKQAQAPCCGGHAAKPPREPSDGDAQTIYTCPMHLEVRQQGPGSCPKCGMALEPAGVPTGDEKDPELEDMTRRFWIAAALSGPLLVLISRPG
jgi:Cu+-exporting ATPase